MELIYLSSGYDGVLDMILLIFPTLFQMYILIV